MIRTLSTAAIALALTAGAAPALAQSAPDWTGPYVGVFGGYTDKNDDDKEALRFDRNLDGNYGDPVVTTTGANAFSPGSCAGAPATSQASDGCDADSSGVQGGVRAGYDYQMGVFVIGAVAEVSGVRQKDAVTSFSTTPASYTFTRNLEQMAALRGRIGVAAGQGLYYLTGGGAVARIENGFYTSNGANSFTTTVDDDKASGYQVGAGAEYQLAPNLTLTGDYIYTSLEPGDHGVRIGAGTAPATNPFILAPNVTGTDTIRSNARFGLHAFNVGMNYRF